MVEMMAAVTISIILILLMYGIDKVQTVFVVVKNRARAMEEARSAMDMQKRF